MLYELPKLILDKANEYCTSNKFSSDKRKKFIENLKEKYNNGLVSPGDAIGLIAAQSIGERGTQLTLRTKHYAGSLEVSVGQGIKRMIEIVDGRSKTKNPSMNIYLKKDVFNSEKKIIKYAKGLIDVKINDIGNFEENFVNKSLVFRVDKDKIEDLEKDEKEIISLVYDSIVDLYSSKKLSKGGTQINFSFDDNTSLFAIRKAKIKWEKIPLFGVKNIEKVVVIKKNGEYVIETKGTNLKEIFKLEEVDKYRTYTNDIFEIYKLLGIEAARYAILKELTNVLKSNRININKRHLFILADLMTSSGYVQGIVRSGITGSKKSPFARASFEETVKHLIAAAFNNEKENLQGITENIIAGLPINAGTGTVKLTLDPKNLKKMIKAERKIEEEKK